MFEYKYNVVQRSEGTDLLTMRLYRTKFFARLYCAELNNSRRKLSKLNPAVYKIANYHYEVVEIKD